MARKRKYTDEQFIESVKESYSIAQVLKKLNLSAAGSNYKLAKLRIEKLKLDSSHFLGQHWAKGTTHNHSPKIPLNKIMVKDSTYTSIDRLKIRLVKAEILKEKCYECGLIEWNGKPISFQLEHKNGDNRDHREKNITFLCPNCHSQTKTFAGRNIK